MKMMSWRGWGGKRRRFGGSCRNTLLRLNTVDLFDGGFLVCESFMKIYEVDLIWWFKDCVS